MSNVKFYTFYELCCRLECDGATTRLLLKQADILDQRGKITYSARNRSFAAIVDGKQVFMTKAIQRIKALDSWKQVEH